MAVGSPNLKAFLVATPFFGGLSDESLDILVSMLVERRFDAGATVVAEGEPGRFATTVPLEKVHPLQAGLFRLKTPSERRPDLPRETPLVFWAQYVWDPAILSARQGGGNRRDDSAMATLYCLKSLFVRSIYRGSVQSP